MIQFFSLRIHFTSSHHFTSNPLHRTSRNSSQFLTSLYNTLRISYAYHNTLPISHREMDSIDRSPNRKGWVCRCLSLSIYVCACRNQCPSVCEWIDVDLSGRVYICMVVWLCVWVRLSERVCVSERRDMFNEFGSLSQDPSHLPFCQ